MKNKSNRSYSDLSARRIITLVRPKDNRKSFALILDTIDENGNRKQKRLKDERIDSLNKAYKSKSIDYNLASEKFEELRFELAKKYCVLKEVGVVHRSNRFLANELLAKTKQKARKKRKKLKPASMKTLEYELNSIVYMLGDNSLYSLSEDEILDILESHKKENGEQYSIKYINRFIVRINQLLKITGRPIKLLELYEQRDHEVNYISEKQLEPLLVELEKLNRANKDYLEYDKDLVIIGFYTGMRIGEIQGFDFTSKKLSLKNGRYYVERQLVRNDPTKGKERKVGHMAKDQQPQYSLPKWDKKRWVILPRQACEALERWEKWTPADHLASKTESSKRIKKASMVAFKSGLNHISAHGLRHSYAHWLLSKGASISDVSLLLGDSFEVCMKHYVGSSHQEDALTRLQLKIA